MRMDSQFIVGMGDVNSDAAAKYTAAGYKGVTCALQTVTSPAGNYTQNQCTDATGQPLSADLAAGMTLAQLTAQRTAETNFASGNANAEIMALTVNPGGGGPVQYFGANPQPNNPYYQGIYTAAGPPPGAVIPPLVNKSPAPAPASGSSGGTQTITVPPAVGDFMSQTVTIAGIVIPVWLLLAGGIGVVFLMGGKR